MKYNSTEIGGGLYTEFSALPTGLAVPGLSLAVMSSTGIDLILVFFFIILCQFQMIPSNQYFMQLFHLNDGQVHNFPYQQDQLLLMQAKLGYSVLIPKRITM